MTLVGRGIGLGRVLGVPVRLDLSWFVGLGVVVATPGARNDLNSPARPVVALLTDGQGEARPRPHHLDLTQSEHLALLYKVRQAADGRRSARVHVVLTPPPPPPVCRIRNAAA